MVKKKKPQNLVFIGLAGWCREEDLNLHDLAVTRSLVL